MAFTQSMPFLISVAFNALLLVIVLHNEYDSNCEQQLYRRISLSQDDLEPIVAQKAESNAVDKLKFSAHCTCAPAKSDCPVCTPCPQLGMLETTPIAKIDIHRTENVRKCDEARTNLSSWSLYYWDDRNPEAKHYGCKVVEMLDWSLELYKKEKRVYSQNGEDGILEEVFNKIGEKSRFFVEFGVQDATQCNTRFLREKGWKGLMFDNEHNNPDIGLYQASVWIDNVVQLFKNRSIPNEFDLLSVDTDFSDFWLLREIMLAGYRPRIVIIEVNTASGPYSSFTIPYKKAQEHGMFLKLRWFGTSVLAVAKLMHAFGYQLLYVEATVTNAIFIQSLQINNIDLARALWQRKQFERLGKPPANHARDKANRPYDYICEYLPCDSSDDW